MNKMEKPRNTFWGIIDKLVCALNMTLLVGDLLTVIKISTELKYQPSSKQQTNVKKIDKVKDSINQIGIQKAKTLGKQRINWGQGIERSDSEAIERRRKQRQKIMAFNRAVNESHRHLFNNSSSRILGESSFIGLNNQNSGEQQTANSRVKQLPKHLAQRSERQTNQNEAQKHRKMVIDHERTLEYNQRNLAIEAFSKAPLTDNPKSYSSSICLLNNILNTVHLSLIQISICSLPQSPVVLLTLLILLELVFILLTIIPFCTVCRFISKVDLCSKITKSVCLEGFFISCLIIKLNSGRAQAPVDENLQRFGMLFISLGIFNSYFFLIIKIVQILGRMIKKRLMNKPKESKEGQDLTLSQRGLIFYKADDLDKTEGNEVAKGLAQFWEAPPQQTIKIEEDLKDKTEYEKQEVQPPDLILDLGSAENHSKRKKDRRKQKRKKDKSRKKHQRRSSRHRKKQQKERNSNPGHKAAKDDEFLDNRFDFNKENIDKKIEKHKKDKRSKMKHERKSEKVN